MYRIKKNYMIVFFLMVVNIFTGCGTIQNVAIPDLKQPISTDKSVVELERPISFVGGGRSPYVYSSGKLIGEIGNGGTLIWFTESNQLECIHLETIRLPLLVDSVILDEKPIRYQCFTTKPSEITKLEIDYIRGRISKKSNEKELSDTFEITKISNISNADTEYDIITLLKNILTNELDTKLVTKNASKSVELFIEEYQEGNAAKRWVAITKEGSTLLKVKVVVKKNNEIIDTYITRFAVVEGGFFTVGSDKLIFDYVGKDIVDYLTGK